MESTQQSIEEVMKFFDEITLGKKEFDPALSKACGKQFQKILNIQF